MFVMDEEGREKAEAAAKVAKELSIQMAEMLKDHTPPVQVSVIADLFARLMACLPEPQAQKIFAAFIALAAVATSEYEKQLRPQPGERVN